MHHVYLYRYQIAWEEKKFNKGLALGNLGHKYGNNLQSQEGSSNVACGGQQPLGSWTGVLNPEILANALLRPTPAKALHLPADAFLGHHYGLLENVEVCNHGEVVGGEC